MRFLEYHYSRTKMNYDTLHEMPIEELVRLRNSIKAFQKMLENWREHLREYVQFNIKHPDFNTLSLNEHMIPEVLDKINGVIGRRNMKTQQERKAKENKEK